MNVDPYLREVEGALQALGVTPQRRADVLAEMESHLLDSGEDPPEAFGPAEVFAQRLAGQLPTGDDEPGGQGWDRPRVRSLVREQMQTNQQLAERGWNPGWKGRPFYRQQARWQSPQAPGSVLDTATAFTAQHHGRLRTRDSDGLTATLGSRIAFRIFGVFMKTGRSRLPIHFQVVVHPNAGGTDVEFTAVEDMGRGILVLSITTAPYEQAFAELLDALRNATTDDVITT
jgi:hypothetical protein